MEEHTDWPHLDLFLGKAPKDRVFEMDVLVGAANQLAGRLICVPLPEDVASQRRRRARADAKRKGRTAGEKTLKRLDWGLFVTNAPKEALPTEAVDVIYRVKTCHETLEHKQEAHLLQILTRVNGVEKIKTELK